MKRRKDPNAVALGRKGGQVVTPAKCEANRIRAVNRWAKIKSRKSLQPETIVPANEINGQVAVSEIPTKP